MRSFYYWCNLLLLLIYSGWVQADEGWTLEFGGGLAVYDTPWVDMPIQYITLPYINAEYGRWQLGVKHGLFQYRLSGDNWPVTLSAGLNYRDETYDSVFNFNDELSEDPIFTGYKSPDGEVTAQVNVAWQHLSASVSQDVTGNSSGAAVDLSYMHPLYQGERGVQLLVGGGVRWLSEKYSDYLYGISGSNIDPQYGRLAYQAEAATNYQLSMQFIYPFSRQWSVSARASYEWLDKTIENSPLVDKSATGKVMVFFTYRKM